MATFAKLKLSASTDGRAVKITSVASPGDAIHTADSTALDEVWIYAVNTQASVAKLTIQWGDTTAPDGNIEASIPGESGLYLVIPGLLLTNSLVVRAFADTANVIMIHGFVNRITP